MSIYFIALVYELIDNSSLYCLTYNSFFIILDEVISFLKQAPWKHTESSGTLSGGPMVLTLMSKYKLHGGLVFSKKCKKDIFVL